MTAVSVRYIVDDVDAAIAFYTERLGFTVECILRPALPCSRAATYGCW
jgi:predicted enzyme related to lactoylglutathione lyase